MSNQTPVRNTDIETPESIAESKEEMRGDPDLMEKQHPAAPLAFVMGAYPIILIFLLIIVAVYFAMSREGPNSTDPIDGPTSDAATESILADPTR